MILANLFSQITGEVLLGRHCDAADGRSRYTISLRHFVVTKEQSEDALQVEFARQTRLERCTRAGGDSHSDSDSSKAELCPQERRHLWPTLSDEDWHTPDEDCPLFPTKPGGEVASTSTETHISKAAR